MMWLNPWAWAGLAGVALPVLIHLLARGHARVQRFPTLRFLQASPLLPTRRTRVHDALLLAVRSGAIILAAAALAHPLLLTATRKQALDRGLARAIVVDTSVSMRRQTPSGVLAVDSARRVAQALAAEAQTSVTIESNDPARVLNSASTWLTTQGRRSELVVISDFQLGQIDSSDFAVVAKGVGVTLHRVPTVRPAALESWALVGGMRVVARTTLAGDRSDVEWSPAGAAASSDAVSLLGGDADRAAVDASRAAATTIATALPIDSTRAIAIVFPKYAGRAALEASGRRAYVPWMLELLGRLQADSLPIAGSSVANVLGRQRLILFTNAEPGSLASARLIAAANHATSIAPPVGELEPNALSDAALASLERPALDDVPSQLHPTDENGPSDGRWFWIGALALLLIELPLRRHRAAASPATPKERTRAA